MRGRIKVLCGIIEGHCCWWIIVHVMNFSSIQFYLKSECFDEQCTSNCFTTKTSAMSVRTYCYCTSRVSCPQLVLHVFQLQFFSLEISKFFEWILHENWIINQGQLTTSLSISDLLRVCSGKFSKVSNWLRTKTSRVVEKLHVIWITKFLSVKTGHFFQVQFQWLMNFRYANVYNAFQKISLPRI